jgi:hypothetical protein
MYRDYEDPKALEELLRQAKAENDGSLEAHENIADLEERIRFAYDDEENG